jgi:hypothetical protein
VRDPEAWRSRIPEIGVELPVLECKDCHYHVWLERPWSRHHEVLVRYYRVPCEACFRSA